MVHLRAFIGRLVIQKSKSYLVFIASIRALLAIIILFNFSPANGEVPVFSNEGVKYSMETHIYKRVGHLDIKADVHRYADGKIRPVIFWIHGGALIGGSREGLPPPKQLEAYLNAGYVVVSIDYRLAPETQLEGIIEDVEDAYAWLRREGPELFKIDPDRIAIMGMSAGGYLTLTSGFRLNPRPKALVSFYGYGDITGPWQSQPYPFYIKEHPIVSKEAAFKTVRGPAISNTEDLGEAEVQGRGDFYMYCRQNGLWPNEVSGHDPAEEPEWFSSYEARQNVTANYPPTMLLHGEKDTDVVFEQSVLMAAELKRHNVEHELISQPHWGHVFDHKEEDPTVNDAHQRVLTFLEKHLK